jgi:hypothetical protein
MKNARTMIPLPGVRRPRRLRDFRAPLCAAVALSAGLLASCSTDPAREDDLELTNLPATDPAADPAAVAAAAGSDGLKDAFAIFTQIFTASGFDQQFLIGYGFHPGLSTEKLSVQGSAPQGSATLQFGARRVFATLNNVPANGSFDLWFVKNTPGSGTVKPETGDQFFKVGHFAGSGSSRSLDVAVGRNVNFDLDMIVVTRGGKDPSVSRIAVGSRTLFEKRFFRARAGKGLDPVSGTVAKDIETTDALVGRGAQLFFNETFGGNGRTCGTCHRADDSLTIDTKFMATLPQSDPLFVAETNPALAKLENPKLMRERGLILENVDGFEDPTRKFVMRGVPHTLALGLTNGIQSAFGGPPDHRLGWGGDGAPGRGTLNEFAFGAVMQHFTKNLARRPGVDFRIPTQEELDALEAFQLFTGRQKPTDFSVLQPTDSHASSGSNLFFGSSCTFCHVDLFGSTTNDNFNTGVANLFTDLPNDNGFRADQSFNVPPLVEAADTPPLFHNNGAANIEDAVAFYQSPQFAASPFGFFNFAFTPQQRADIAAFLRVVNAAENIRQVRKRVAFVQSHRSTGNTDLLAVAIADTRDALAVLSAKNLNRAVQAELRDVQTTLANAKADADQNRPAAMAHAIVFLALASKGLLKARSVPDGGMGGTGGGMGGPDGGVGGAGGSMGTGGVGGFGGFGDAGTAGSGGFGGAGMGGFPGSTDAGTGTGTGGSGGSS